MKGHPSTHCRNPARCGKCLKRTHNTEECWQDEICENCGKKGDPLKSCQSPRDIPRCGKCKKTTHQAHQCWSEMLCANCQQVGHPTRVCGKPFVMPSDANSEKRRERKARKEVKKTQKANI